MDLSATDDLTATTRGLRDAAADLRLLAGRLADDVAGLWWEGRAGDAVRSAVSRRVRDLDDAARACADAADALGRVRAGVERLEDAAHEAADAAHDLVEDAAGTVGDLAGALGRGA